MNYKDTKILINEKRSHGKTNQEIYSELKDSFSNKTNLATFITSTAKEEDIKAKSRMIIILGILMGVIAIAKVILLLYVYDQIHTITPFFKMRMYSAFAPSIAYIALIFLLPKHNPTTYRSILANAIFDAAVVFQFTNQFPLVLAYFPILAYVAFLAFDLETNLFPNFSTRKLKKDETGDFIIPD